MHMYNQTFFIMYHLLSYCESGVDGHYWGFIFLSRFNTNLKIPGTKKVTGEGGRWENSTCAHVTVEVEVEVGMFRAWTDSR